jgi:hypothetical protein
MKKSCVAILITSGFLSIIPATQAGVIADWTFESSVPSGTGPASVGPFNAEIGTGSAYAVGLGTISSPAGNGSPHSLSANGWTNAIPASSYYQFNVSTVGNSSIGVTFDQTSSATGPANFQLQYSTDGISFTTFASYSPLVNASPNPVWNMSTSSSLYTFNFDLSSITVLNNASTVDFRLQATGLTSENGGTIALGGTDRVDNFIVSTVPEPSTLALSGLAGIFGLVRILRRKS